MKEAVSVIPHFVGSEVVLEDPYSPATALRSWFHGDLRDLAIRRSPMIARR